MSIAVNTWRPAALAAALVLLSGCREEPVITNTTPLLIPVTTTLAGGVQCVGEQEESSCASLEVSAELTGVDWVDRQILQQLLLEQVDQEVLSAAELKKMIAEQGDAWLAQGDKELQEALEEGYSLNYEQSAKASFLYQRGSLASFKVFHYGYSGGAHGMYTTSYQLLDLDGQRVLELNDILRSGQEQALYEALMSRYQTDYNELAESWLSGSEQEIRATLLSGSFVFNDQGLVFVYPPYVLGPYSEGEVRLPLYAYQLEELLRPGYPFTGSE